MPKILVAHDEEDQEELITHRFELESIAEAFALASQPTHDSLKLVVLP